jgi:hypothetical protein
MASDLHEIQKWVAYYGPSVDHIAAQYTNPVNGKQLSGSALLAKVLQGESGSWRDPTAGRTKVSSAGARAWGQFMPDSRRTAIERYGVDPWRSIKDAVHATSLHLRGKINGSTGLEGYNPGMASYPAYILGQHVGHVPSGSGGAGGARRVGAPGAGSAAATAGPGASFDAGGIKQAVLALQPAPQPIGGSIPQMPDFAAGPPLPQAYPGAPSSGGPVPAPAPIELPAQSDLSLPPAVAPGASASGLPGAAAGGGGGGGQAPPKLRAGGNWGGSFRLAQPARALAAKSGWRVSSTKRDPAQNAAAGGSSTSDHLTTNKYAWAYDLSNGSQTANDAGRRLARNIARRYDVTFRENSTDSGGVIVVGGVHYKVQILYGDDIEHGDHVHVGIHRLG